MTDYTPKHFDRESPCSKVDIHNCFYRGGKHIPRLVIEARTVIGLNVPKYLLREGFAVLKPMRGQDYYELTTEGKAWLTHGILRFLELHPEAALDCLENPAGYGRAQPRKQLISRSKPVQTRGKIVRRQRG